MRELKTPHDLLQLVSEKYGSRPAISIFTFETEKHPSGWDVVSGEQLKGETLLLTRLMTIPGIDKNSRIALWGEVSTLWIKIYLAGLCRGAQVCLLDTMLLSADIEKILAHFEPTHLFVGPSFFKEALKFSKVKAHQLKLLRFQDLQDLPTGLAENPGLSDGPYSTVIYTSGTSGDPKAVVMAFEAMLFDCQAVTQVMSLDSRVLNGFSILPLNHLYGLSCGLFYCLIQGLEFFTTQSLLPQDIREILKSKQIGAMLAVPLFLKMIRAGIYSKIREASLPRRVLFKVLLTINQRLKSSLFARLFFSQLLEAFGGQMQFVVTGGAPLEKKVQLFFEGLGWRIFNGYGLTETGPVVAVNSFLENKIGSVGKPLSGVEVKIQEKDPDDIAGEIWVRGANLFSEYAKAPQLTKEAITDDGWFKTGDLGSFDKEGYLFIVGRIKSMIVLTSGKKVQPEEIEEVLLSLEFVKEVCVVAVADKVMGEKILAVVQLAEDPALAPKPEQVEQRLRAACQHLAPYKRPHEFILRNEAFPMTSTKKVRRHLVQKEYMAVGR